ncbi:BglG family transcription antiterminator [Tetragenococcus koreensis]|uniref:Transcriptional antiterminator n=1 Tax=Tetragenococcus koreensis TaxID=290335 RepID=A0AAN4UDR8_9ENTE|nr:PRD domain-containing protein [Tetragenococcus koreensis]MCF1627467.1 PRD domain-containing protein [Tetragenococcus koreensis]GEQ50564.1 transcriptional antiterminator [Tetragenococcus koreensis]GEQ53060.1 transcriptional antiterminator [Tetragenococcus koreensis]GEQ55572.1 transcriptional antiterminator [Tetragenococcus koreensis]GEQ58069.1 transcriptional antiterminator [Tetragenococcus koreensis]
MQEKWIELLITLLKSSHAITGRSLSDTLNVSTRSIRNYVREVNRLTQDKIIEGSDIGYILVDETVATKLIRSSRNIHQDIPQNEYDRYVYIVKKLLRNESINAFDLADELFISYGTLKRTIQYTNKQLIRWDVEIKSVTDQLYLIGKETDKRKLFSYLIYRENTGNLINTAYLSESFGKEKTYKAQNVLDEVIDTYRLNINEFAYNNVLMHLLILISRIPSNNTDDSREETSLEITGYTKQLIRKIETSFQIKIDTNEQTEINILMKSSATEDQAGRESSNFSEKFTQQITQIISKVFQMYNINLKSEFFTQPFSIHIHHLIYRMENEYFLKNPIKTNIIDNFPLVYDIATYIAFQIKDIWQFNIPEDEIAFIALHIGTEIERQKNTTEKLKVLIIAPQYLEIDKKARSFLQENFSKDIIILNTIDSLNLVDNLSPYDLIFSTLTDENIGEIPARILQLEIFNLDKQKGQIQTTIDRVFKQKKKQQTREQFFTFFSTELFWINNDNISKDKILNIVSEQMRNLKAVNASFLDQIKERDTIGTTVFNNIAIVHPMDFSSPKTKIATVLSENGIKWNDSIAHIIFIISISKDHKDDFRDIYENLMEFLSEKNKLEFVIKSKDLNDFYNRLLS